MDRFEELYKAQRTYDDLYNLINSGEYNPTENDFYDLARARQDLESAYADTYTLFDEIIDKGDFR